MQLRGLELNFRVKLFCCKICRYCKYILQPNCKTQFQLQEQQKANILFLNSFVQNWLALVHKNELENIFVLFWFYDLCRPKTWRVLILKSYLDIIFFAKMHLITTAAAWFKVYYKSKDVTSPGHSGHIAILQSGDSHKLRL